MKGGLDLFPGYSNMGRKPHFNPDQRENNNLIFYSCKMECWLTLRAPVSATTVQLLLNPVQELQPSDDCGLNLWFTSSQRLLCHDCRLLVWSLAVCRCDIKEPDHRWLIKNVKHIVPVLGQGRLLGNQSIKRGRIIAHIWLMEEKHFSEYFLLGQASRLIFIDRTWQHGHSPWESLGRCKRSTPLSGSYPWCSWSSPWLSRRHRTPWPAANTQG